MIGRPSLPARRSESVGFTTGTTPLINVDLGTVKVGELAVAVGHLDGGVVSFDPVVPGAARHDSPAGFYDDVGNPVEFRGTGPTRWASGVPETRSDVRPDKEDVR